MNTEAILMQQNLPLTISEIRAFREIFVLGANIGQIVFN